MKRAANVMMYFGLAALLAPLVARAAGGKKTARVQPVYSASPANDNFAGAFALSGARVLTASGNNAGATREPGEPPGGNRTLWWKWTAPATSVVAIDTAGSTVSTCLAVRQGQGPNPTVSTLTTLKAGYGFVTSNYVAPASFRFQAVAGQVYYFSLGDTAAAGGTVNLRLATPPANDGFAAAVDLGATGTQTATGDNLGATPEPGEASDYNGSRASVWWKFRPTAGGTVEAIDTFGSDYDTTLEVYTGASLPALAHLRSSNNARDDYTSRVAFPVTANATYYIRVSGPANAAGNITLHLKSTPAPADAASHLVWGRAYLEQAAGSLSQADAEFAAALAASPNDPQASVLQALTKIALLQAEPDYALLLKQLGAANATANPLRIDLSIPRDARHVPVPASTANSSQVLRYLQQDVVPALDAADGYFAKVTDPTFLTTLSDAEDGHRYIKIDYADVQILRAAIQGVKAASYFSQTYNLRVSLATLSSQARTKTLDATSVKHTYNDLLKFGGSDQRRAISSTLNLANNYYQIGSVYVRDHRFNPFDRAYLFPLPLNVSRELNLRKNAQDVSDSLNGEILWEGTQRVNLSRLVTTPLSIRDMLGNFQGNLVIANTAPDPTFDGAIPDGTQAKVNDVLAQHKLLYDISTFSSWAAKLLPGKSAAEQAPEANPSGDGLNNRFKFAFGLDPSRPSVMSNYLVQDLVADASDHKQHFTIAFARRIDTSAVTYVVAVSDDLVHWDRTQTALEQVGDPVRNDDGITETVVVRAIADASIAARLFLRVEATVAIPSAGN